MPPQEVWIRPDGHVQRLLQIAAEVVGRPPEKFADRARVALAPLSLDFGERFVRGGPRNGEQADHRVLGVLDGLLGVVAAVQAHLHVGLAATNPHFTDVNVLEGDGVVALDNQRVGSSGHLRRDREGNSPLAVLIGLDRGGAGSGCQGLDCLEDHADFLSGSGRSPDGALRAPLQDHTVGEEGVRFHVGVGLAGQTGRGRQHHGGQNTSLHGESPGCVDRVRMFGTTRLATAVRRKSRPA